MDKKSLIILVCFCILILCFNPFVEGDANLGRCGNALCSVPIGKGIATIAYNPNDENKISVVPNEEVLIFVRDYGPKKDLLGVKVKEKKGYISKQFVRETASFTKVLVPAAVEFKSEAITSDATVLSNQWETPESVPHSVYENPSYMPENSPYNSETHQESSSFSHPNPNGQVLPSLYDVSNAYVDNTVGFSHYDYDSSLPLESSDFYPEVSYIQSTSFDPSAVQHDGSTFQGLDTSSLLNQADLFHQQGRVPTSQSTDQFGVPDVVQNSFDPSHSSHQQGSSLQSIDQFQVSDVVQNSYEPSHSSYQQFHSPDLSLQPSPSLSQPDLHVSHNFQRQQSFYVQDQGAINQQPIIQSSKVLLNQPPPFASQEASQFSQNALHDSVHPPPNSLHENHLNLMEKHPKVLHHDSSKLNLLGGPNLLLYGDQQVQNKRGDPNAAPKAKLNHMDFLDEDFPLTEEFLKTLAAVEKMEKESEASYPNPVPVETSQGMPHDSSHPVQSSSQESPLATSAVKPTPVHEDMPLSKVPEDTSGEARFYNGDLPRSSDEAGLHDSSMNSAKRAEAESDDEEEEDEDDVSLVEETDDVLEEISSNLSLEEAVYDASLNLSSDQKSEAGSHKSSLDAEKVNIKENGSDEEKLNDASVSKPSSDEKSAPNDIPSPGSESSILKPIDDSKFSFEKLSDSLIKDSVYSSVIVDAKINQDSSKAHNNGFDETTHNNSKVVESLVNNPDASSSTFHKIEDPSFLKEKREHEAKIDSSVNTPENSSGTANLDSPVNELLSKKEESSEPNQFTSTAESITLDDAKTTYQGRSLKEDLTTEATIDNSDQYEMIDESDLNELLGSKPSVLENWLASLKSLTDSFMPWMPEPIYSATMDLQDKGISPRVPVFTAICGFSIVLLIVLLFFIKEFSKEAKLSTQLAFVEKDAYNLSATNAVLEEKLQSLQSLLKSYEKTAEDEKQMAAKLKIEYEELTQELESTREELENSLAGIESMKVKENDYLSQLCEHSKEKKELNEQKDCLEKLIKENEDTISNLTMQLRESESNVKLLEAEKEQLLQLKEDYEEKLSQFEMNCNQLLQEAEVWNLRVNELTAKLNEERTSKEEIESLLKERAAEVESLKELVETFQTFEEMEDPEEKAKTKEEKLELLLNSSLILKKLEKQVEETKLLSEQLEKEKTKVLDSEVELLEARSEIDKLKISYNQALQDKAEAQTKLEVLTNYFKDKEIQLQKQLGVHEAVRQKKEEDASSAERRITLIEQENASYKYQVASMKQEMEETERNLKSQIATQEKKAHENWIAARAAERKLEETKQEITQLRQRLTLLERQQENWEKEEIIKPVPKRANGDGGPDMNMTDRSLFPPHDRPLPPPHLLPMDRPLPPLLPVPPPPPPPHMMFMPPGDRHFRPPPPPWHLPPDPNVDFRATPPEFLHGRESTPPRGRPFPSSDSERGPHASSPLTTDTRDSINSTPPHLLPNFHDIPPQPGRPPFFPPPPHHRPPLHPPHRRDVGPGPKRIENSIEYQSRSNQPPPPLEEWQQSRV